MTQTDDAASALLEQLRNNPELLQRVAVVAQQQVETQLRREPKQDRDFDLEEYRERFGTRGGTTHWKNPTPHNVSFRLHVERPTARSSGVWVVRIGPGEVAQVPSQFDGAIRKIREGHVVAGLAPQLQQVAAPGSDAEPHNPPLHPALAGDTRSKRRRRAT